MKERLPERQADKKICCGVLLFFYKMEKLQKKIKEIKKDDRHELY